MPWDDGTRRLCQAEFEQAFPKIDAADLERVHRVVSCRAERAQVTVNGSGEPLPGVTVKVVNQAGKAVTLFLNPSVVFALASRLSDITAQTGWYPLQTVRPAGAAEAPAPAAPGSGD